MASPLARRQLYLAIAFLAPLFVSFVAIRWPGELPIGTDCDEHLIVARTFIKTGHFSVADVHATKYPPLVSSVAIFLQYLGINVPLAMVAFNYLLVLASALTLHSLVLRNNRIGVFSVLPIVYLLSNTVLWSSASEIFADAVFFFLVTLVLLFALSEQEWTLRKTLLAALLAFLAAMSRTIGLVVMFPLAVSIIADRRRRGVSFPYVRLALLAVPPVVSTVLYMAYQAGFGPHATGYVETFLLKDPFDASKGSLTLFGFLGRAVSGTLHSLRDLRDLTVYPSSPGVFSWAAAIYPSLAGVLSLAALLALFVFALGRDKRRCLVLLSFILPYLVVVSLWPYKGARFVLPLLALTTLGVAGALASTLRSRNLVLSCALLGLLLSHTTINTANLRQQAEEQRQERAFLHHEFRNLVGWCRANIPETERIASFDYREIILRLDRPVMPLGYSSDAQAHIAELERGDVKWLVICHNIYPLRGTYAKGIVDALGEKASLKYTSNSCEAYRLDLP